MQDAPDTPELLRIARLTLLEKVLPLMPAETSREVRMVASALAIAQRSLALRAQASLAERQRLEALLPEDGQLTTDELNRKLATELRSWRFGANPQREADVVEHLLQCTTEKLQENNPKALQGT